MERGEEKLFAWRPLSWAVRRSSDGLWAWEAGGPVLPCFSYKYDGDKKLSVLLGEYMFFFWWVGGIPYSLQYAAWWIICKLSFGRYKIVERKED